MIVDLAAETGGNCEYTKQDQVVRTPKGVTVVGYTDLPSRLAGQSSTLYSNNISKFLLSMGPFSTGKKGEFLIDHKDDAVRGALVLEGGEMRWPAPPLPTPPQAAKPVEAKKEPEGPKDLRPETMSNALTTTGAMAGILGMGMLSPNAAFSSMMTKFGLASICGYQTVWGVTPALHSPLMSVTNAISGLTAVGGITLAGGGLLPHTGAQTLAAAAVITSAVNIGGGFTITQRMLDMFRRPTDPIEHVQLYAIPAGALISGFFAGHLMGFPGITNAAYLASSGLCIASIACLSNQASARTGNALGLMGVSGGVAATIGSLGADIGTLAQIAASMGIGGGAGYALAKRMAITDLPQMVAGFHSLVGFAAAATSIAQVMMLADSGHAMDALHKSTAYLGTLIGAVSQFIH